MVREGPAQTPPLRAKTYSAEKVRGGEIILKKPIERGIFIAGLVGAVLLVLVLGLLAIRM